MRGAEVALYYHLAMAATTALNGGYATMTLLNHTIHMAYYGPGGLRYQKIPLAIVLGK